MSALTLNSTILNSTILCSTILSLMILSSMILNAMILRTVMLNATILNCVNKSAPTQLAHTTVPVAVTTTLLMTYIAAWVGDTYSYYCVIKKSYMHVLMNISSVQSLFV